MRLGWDVLGPCRNLPGINKTFKVALKVLGGFPKSGVPVWGGPYNKGLQHIRVYIGVLLFRETTTYAMRGSSLEGRSD